MHTCIKKKKKGKKTYDFQTNLTPVLLIKFEC